MIGVSVFRWGFLSSFLDGVGGMICVVWNDLIWIYDGSGTAEVVGMYVDRCMGEEIRVGNCVYYLPIYWKRREENKKKEINHMRKDPPIGIDKCMFCNFRPAYLSLFPRHKPPNYHITSHHHISLGTNILIVHRHSY